MFQEGKFYIYTTGLCEGYVFICCSVKIDFVSLKNINTNTVSTLHRKHEYFTLINFVECSSLLKELI